MKPGQSRNEFTQQSWVKSDQQFAYTFAESSTVWRADEQIDVAIRISPPNAVVVGTINTMPANDLEIKTQTIIGHDSDDMPWAWLNIYCFEYEQCLNLTWT